MVKAVVAGASGGIGQVSPFGAACQSRLTSCQPLSLLLKSNKAITELALYDVVNTPGVAADISHISTPAVRNSLPHCLGRD